MPFYIANPRRGAGGVQKRGDKVEYQRTAPSMFVVNVMAGFMVIYSSLVQYLHMVFFLVNSPITTAKMLLSETRSPTPLLNKAQMIPFRIPNIILCFKGQLPSNVQDRFNEWDIEAERITNIRKDVYIVRNPDYNVVKEILTFSGLDNEIRPPADHITPAALVSWFTLISALSSVVSCLRVVAKNPSMGIEFKGGHFSDDTPVVQPEPEEGELPESMETDKETTTAGPSKQPERHFVFSEGKINIAVPINQYTVPDSCWGTDQTVVEEELTGIFCPYESNYSIPDYFAIKNFLQRFHRFIGDSDNDDLDTMMEHWAQQLSNTVSGQQVAHVMATLELAIQANASIFVLQTPSEHYDGSIIVAPPDSFYLHGPSIQRVYPVGHAALVKELGDFGFHFTTLKKIVDMTAIKAPINTITSMRYLRELVFAGTGRPQGVTENKISKLLPKLAFYEKPLGVNTDAVSNILDLLASDEEPPRELFLDHRSFFSENRTQLILAAWGVNPPTFNFGGSLLRACAQASKGSTSLAVYSTTPPLVLQMKRVPMDNAIAGWNTMLQRGVIWGIYDKKIKQSRSFTGKEKVLLWNKFAEVLSGSISQPSVYGEDMTQVRAGPSQKRGADEMLKERTVKKLKAMFD